MINGQTLFKSPIHWIEYFLDLNAVLDLKITIPDGHSAGLPGLSGTKIISAQAETEIGAELGKKYCVVSSSIE